MQKKDESKSNTHKPAHICVHIPLRTTINTTQLKPVLIIFLLQMNTMAQMQTIGEEEASL